MIKITEISPPIKQPGVSSIILEFNYSPEIVSAVKSLSNSIWHKKYKVWEVPISELSKALDTLTFYDDISLKLITDAEFQELQNSESSGGPLTEEEIGGFKLKPFQHQIDAINYGLTNHKKWLLLDAPGVGKTTSALYLAETLYNRGKIKHCLVICGVDSLRSNWKAEINQFSNLSALVLGEKVNKKGRSSYTTIAERSQQLKNKIEEFFIIVNISTLRDDRFIEAFNSSENEIGMIIYDEAHRCGRSSQSGTNLLKLKADYKVAMTGTLLTNNVLSAFLPLSWTDNLKATMTHYKSCFCTFGGFGGYQVTGYQNLDLLKDLIESCSLRRTFQQVRGDMPKKTIAYELLEMSEEHQKFYEAIKDGVKEEANKVELNTNNLLAMMTRLRQATASPSILTTEPIISSKVERAVELAEDLLLSGEKVLILSNFKQPVYDLKMKLEEFHPLLGTGDQADDEIRTNIDKFRNSPNFNILLATHSKLGTGFSMPECHYMIMLDTPFTYAQFSQSVDRIYRITSDQPVYIKVLSCKDTVDERVWQIVENKRDLSDFVIDNKENALSQELKSIILSL